MKIILPYSEETTESETSNRTNGEELHSFAPAGFGSVARPNGFDEMTVNRWDLIGFLAALLACCRFALPLLEPEESRYAELPRQMMESGSWLIPTLDGQPYLDKPPLLYWLVAATYQLFGVSVLVARIVPTIATAFAAWVVFRWVRQKMGQNAGIFAAAILLLMPDFCYRGPQLTMNGLLATATTASLAAGYAAIAKDRFRWSWWIVSAICCGLGLLAKGPIAAALVGLPLAIVPWLDRRLVRPSILAIIGFAIIAIAVAGPWFLLVAQRQPDFINYFFWKHHVDRVVHPFDHVKPWWYYLPQVLLGTLPWTPVLFLAAYRWLRGREIPTLATFGLFAGVIGILLFSISGSKRPVYLVPVYPPLAVACAAFLWNRWPVHKVNWLRFTVIYSVMYFSGMALFHRTYHNRFSAGPVLEQARRMSDDATRLYAVPYGSPAASFAFQRIVPTVPLERFVEIPPPRNHETVILFVPPRRTQAVRDCIKSGEVMTIENGELTALIWSRGK